MFYAYILFAVLNRIICCNRAGAEISTTSPLHPNILHFNSVAQAKEGDVHCYGEGRRSTKKIISKQTKLPLVVKKSSINKRNVLPFCNRHAGQSAILLGSGPTLKTFLLHSKVYSFENIVTAGVNSVIYAGIPLDYLFVFDKGKKVYRGKRDSSWLENPEAFDAFECRIQKFYGYFKRSPNFGPPIRSNSGAKLIEGSYVTNKPLPLNKDVGHYQFGGSVSTIFHALQFLLYAGVSKVYLVGCDAGTGYAQLEDHALDNHRNKKGIKAMLKEWKVAHDFIGNEYSNVNITVLNPIGLKGIGWREIYDVIEIFTEVTHTKKLY